MKNIFWCCVVLLGLSVGLFAQEGNGGFQISGADGRLVEDNSDEYVIGIDDTLNVNVWRDNELSMTNLTVRPDGKITLPLINEIQASGKTPNQLREDITAKLSDYFEVVPPVTVSVSKIVSHTVSVMGQVSKPAIYVLTSYTTVIDIIVRAGGLSGLAKSKDIKIVRKVNGANRIFRFNYKEVIQGKNLEQNIKLEDGDTILVP